MESREKRLAESGKEWTIIKYAPSESKRWDEFVKTSRNATFLHLRGYMDYHADRFTDFSLMAFKGGRLRALLPANITIDGQGGRVLHSHQGLTYGGWLLPERHVDGVDILTLFQEWLEFCRSCGMTGIDYKPLPHIYARMASEEDLYALYRSGARIESVMLSEAIRRDANPGFNTLQKRNLKKTAAERDVEIEELTSPEAVREFYEMLCGCLSERHSATPVHSLAELERLRGLFPENIRIFGCRMRGELQAGVCLYMTPMTLHCQYIATTPFGRERGLLTRLFSYLIAEVSPQTPWFDFGTSNENGGLVLNDGLLRQKASLGGSGVAYMRYGIKL